MTVVDATAYACIAAGVAAMVPWRSMLARAKQAFSPKAQPAVEPPSVIVDEAPAGTPEYISALRSELSKETPDFILDCATKGLSVTEAIREAYQR
jgi:hypothetical protein